MVVFISTTNMREKRGEEIAAELSSTGGGVGVGAWIKDKSVVYPSGGLAAGRIKITRTMNLVVVLGVSLYAIRSSEKSQAGFWTPLLRKGGEFSVLCQQMQSLAVSSSGELEICAMVLNLFKLHLNKT